MKTLLRWGLWQKRHSILWWSIAMFALIFVNLVFYPSFRDQAATLEQSFAEIPDSARALISDTGDLFSPVGYLSSQVYYLVMPMMLGIYGIGLGSSLIAREEKSGSLELLLSRPISRSKLLLSKAIIGLVCIFAVSLISTLTTIVMSKIVGLNVPAGNIIQASLVCTLLVLCFSAIAYMVASLGKARVASIGIATFFSFGGYIIASLSGAATWLEWPSKLFPFHYYHSARLLEGTYHWENALVLLGITVVCGIVSWAAFRRRDIG